MSFDQRDRSIHHCADDLWKMRIIQKAFPRLMFGTEGV